MRLHEQLTALRKAIHIALKNAPATARDAVIVFVLGLIVWADFETLPFIYLTGFYLLPIYLAIWYCEIRLALFVTVVATAMNFYITSKDIPADTPFWQSALAYASVTLVFIIFFAMMRSLKAAVYRLKSENQTDALTSLRSRRNFFEMAQFEISRAARSGDPFTMAMIDLDNFKHVNDTQGHSAGDALLVAVSRCLTAGLREIDIVGRLGGDEFAVLLPGATGDHATAVLERLHSSLRTLLHSFSPSVSSSIGAVFVPSGLNITVAAIIERADAVMYSVKHASKDGIIVESLA
jgi:diguanylate cyclase (GGDEF)-like protein